MLKMSQLFKRPKADSKVTDASASRAADHVLGDADLDKIAGGGTGYKPGTTGGQCATPLMLVSQ
jgi:hypothetical protein